MVAILKVRNETNDGWYEFGGGTGVTGDTGVTGATGIGSTGISGDTGVTGSTGIMDISSGTRNSGDTGVTGKVEYDSNYVYFCVTTNTWVRVPITAW